MDVYGHQSFESYFVELQNEFSKLVFYDREFADFYLSQFKNASDFINWKNKQQNPDLFKTPQDAYLYELWKVMEEEFNDHSSEEAKEIADDFHARESWVHNKLSRGRKKLKIILLRDEV